MCVCGGGVTDFTLKQPSSWVRLSFLNKLKLFGPREGLNYHSLQKNRIRHECYAKDCMLGGLPSHG